MNDLPCTYRVSVKAIIKDDAGRILLLREKDGSWEFPGGGLEHGESWREGLTREVAEETGLQVERVSQQPVAFWTIRKEVGSPTLTWFAFVAYEVDVTGMLQAHPKSEEAEAAKYFETTEIPSLKLHDNTKPYFL